MDFKKEKKTKKESSLREGTERTTAWMALGLLNGFQNLH